MDKVAYIDYMYECFIQEFTQLLQRELTEEEKGFLKWLAQKSFT